MKKSKDILFEVPEGSGKFYKSDDLTPTRQPYDDAIAYDESGDVYAEENDGLQFNDSWFLPSGSVAGNMIDQADSNKIILDGDITISDDLTVSGDYLNVDSNGKVGLGTPQPNKIFYMETTSPQSARKMGGYEESEDVIITGPPAEDDYVTIKFKTIEGESVELSTKWAVPEETSGKTYFANQELYEKYTVSVKSGTVKPIVYVNSEDAYYYLEDLKPNGKPYDDARPLSREFAEKQIKEKQKSEPGSRNLLDLF